MAMIAALEDKVIKPHELVDTKGESSLFTNNIKYAIQRKVVMDTFHFQKHSKFRQLQESFK